MELADVIAALTAVGVLPAISIAAVIAVGAMLYKRFRS